MIKSAFIKYKLYSFIDLLFFKYRLAERSKYLLPCSADGLLLTTGQEFDVEANRLKATQQNQNILIEFVDRKATSKWPKNLRFTNFNISTEPGDNVCVLKSGTILVVRDIIEDPVGSGEIFVVGQKFKSIYDAFDNPFPSSKFGIFICTNINHTTDDWSIDCISGKMYIVPYKLNKSEEPDLLKSKQTWYATPMQHTLL